MIIALKPFKIKEHNTIVMSNNTDFSLAEILPTQLQKKLESKCRKALHEYQMLSSEDQKIGIALSGGKDSLTLLYLLDKIRGKGFPHFDIVAFHVSGTYSCGPSISKGLVKQFCEERNIKLVILEGDIPLEKLSCYPCSRLRRSLIFNAAKKEDIRKIAFGHHRDDNIETLLLNLFHKAEFAGNLPKVPMHDYDIEILRPLFFIEEEEIKGFAKQVGFARITCQCPVGQKSKRKDVKTLIEEIKHYFPNIKTNLSFAIEEYGSKKALKK